MLPGRPCNAIFVAICVIPALWACLGQSMLFGLVTEELGLHNYMLFTVFALFGLVSEDLGMYNQALGSSGRLWEALGELWEALGELKCRKNQVA